MSIPAAKRLADPSAASLRRQGMLRIPALARVSMVRKSARRGSDESDTRGCHPVAGHYTRLKNIYAEHLMAPAMVTDPPRRFFSSLAGFLFLHFLYAQRFIDRPYGGVARVLAIPLRIRHIRDAKHLMSPATRRGGR